MSTPERGAWFRWWRDRSARRAQAADRSRAPQVGERRQITVMFVDVVDSTVMAEEHEPEVVRDVLRAYQDACGRAITAHGGYIHRYVGDGIMVYFGYPSAHEDDARHAVLTGLDIMRSIAEIAPGVRERHGVDLGARVGIHTGVVLMSDMGSDSFREPSAAIGSTPNEAARLQSLAPPDAVVISDDTYEIVRGYFDVEPLGTPQLKGIERQVAVFRVLGQTGAMHRLQAAAGARTPLVGRRVERDALREVWDALAAPSSAGARVHTVTVLGEAGIGKSRLAEWLATHAESADGAVFTALCASDRQASRFFPVIGMLERGLDLSSAVGQADDRATQLEAACATLGLDTAATLPFLVDVLGIPADPRFALPALDPHLLRQRTFDALTELVHARARRAPLLVSIEDVQWADQTTLEWLTRLSAVESDLPYLVLAMARPEFRAPWAGPSCRTIELGPLPTADHMDLIRELAGLHSIPEDVWNLIADRSDGNPLFTEELAKTIAERSNGSRSADAIPPTIRDLLAARLDALGNDKELAQSASVIGRDVDVDLLQTVTGRSRKQLANGLDALSRAGILEESNGGALPTSRRFVHALVRDAAYESQEQGRARGVHAQVAQALATRAGADPGLVAQHFDSAAEVGPAVNWYLLAGAAAQSATADAEAIRYLDRGLELLPRLDPAPQRDVLEFNLHLVRGTSHVSTQGYSAPGAVADFRRSLELSEEVASGIDAVPPTAAIWAYYLVHGDLHSAGDAIDRLRAMSRPELEAEILCCVGVQLSYEGRFRESLEILTSSVEEFERRAPDAGAPRSWLLPNDSRAVALTHLGLVLALVGETRAGNAHLEQAMEVARSLPQYPTGAFTEAYVASYSGLVASLAQHFEHARACHEHALGLGERYGMQFWLSTATAGCAIASGNLGDPRAALDVLTPALEQWRSLGAGALVPLDLTHRAQLHLQVGDFADARADVDAALALADRTSEHFFTAETHRVRAAILLASHPDELDPVRADLADACSLAAEQGAWLFELRAALDLAELPGTAAAPDVDRVRNLLARAPDGADVPELERARALVGA